MARMLTRGTALALILTAVAATTIWVTAKPYQQDRILIELGLKAR